MKYALVPLFVVDHVFVEFLKATIHLCTFCLLKTKLYLTPPPLQRPFCFGFPSIMFLIYNTVSRPKKLPLSSRSLLWAYQKSPRTRQEPISLSVVTFASTLIELYIVISTMSCTFRALSWNNYCFSLMETSNMSSKYIIYKQ